MAVGIACEVPSFVRPVYQIYQVAMTHNSVRIRWHPRGEFLLLQLLLLLTQVWHPFIWAADASLFLAETTLPRVGLYSCGSLPTDQAIALLTWPQLSSGRFYWHACLAGIIAGSQDRHSTVAIPGLKLGARLARANASVHDEFPGLSSHCLPPAAATAEQ